jgi:glycosyltransferase involved in cell wall biosynthesis
MMRVLVIPESFPTEEQPVAGIFMKDQLKALKIFADVTVFNSNPWYRGVYEQVEDVRFFDFHLFSKKTPTILKPVAYKWWERQSLAMAKKIPKPDIIHLHGATLRGGWALKLARYWKVPLVVSEHTGPWSSIAQRKRLFKRAKRVMETADAVLPVSHHLQKEILESGISPRKFKVLGNPVDTELFSLRPLSLASSKTILFIGRLDEFKGALRTLKAFHRVADRLPGYHLKIVGSGEEEKAIRAYIDQHKLQGRVQCENKGLNREEMRDEFHRAAFLVFPSLFESFGLVGAEAMATGLPVVISNRTGPVDYSTELNSITVNPDSTEDIGRGITRMVDELNGFDPEKIRGCIQKMFGYRAYGEGLERCYKSGISKA